MFSTKFSNMFYLISFTLLFSVFFSKFSIVNGKSFVSQIFDTPNCDEIEKKLYLGNAKAACNTRMLRKLNITHILTVDNQPIPKEISSRKGITYLYIKAMDSSEQNLMSYFPITNSFIEEGIDKGSVLVHCHRGISRSSTLVIAYIMQKYNVDYYRALRYVRERRSIVQPNSGFEEQLEEYYNQNFKVKISIMKSIHKTAAKHKYKIASAAMLLACIIIVPMAILI